MNTRQYPVINNEGVTYANTGAYSHLTPMEAAFARAKAYKESSEGIQKENIFYTQTQSPMDINKAEIIHKQYLKTVNTTELLDDHKTAAYIL